MTSVKAANEMDSTPIVGSAQDGGGAHSVWIDLDNSPHVPLFAPIIEVLGARGCSVLITARDCFQVRELAELLQLPYRSVGHHHGKRILAKAVGTGIRALQLLRNLGRARPSLAVSHGSRSQLIASRLIGTPSVLMLDYEFARTIPGLAPTWVMAPEVIPENALPKAKRGVLTYPGIKEDVYVPRFRPDSTLTGSLGVVAEYLLATVRPPATEAHYHNPASEDLFEHSVEKILAVENSQIVALPRTDRQAARIRARWPSHVARNRIIIPPHAIEGLNLIWHSDLVVSGGGTMNREAAALGVPVYSVFRGKIGAVDRGLQAAGRLTLLETVQDVRDKLHVILRKKSSTDASKSPQVLGVIVDQLLRALSESTRRKIA